MKTYLYNGPQPTTVTIQGKPYKLAPGKAVTLPESSYVAGLLERGLLSNPMPEDAPRKIAPVPPMPPTTPDSPRGKAGKGEPSNDSKGDS